MFRTAIGNVFQKTGSRMIQKDLEAKYGQQIGKVSRSGNKVFQRKVGDSTITTGLTWDNKVISEVIHTGDKIKGITKKIRYNEAGDIVEVSRSRRATDYRYNTSHNLETGELKSKILDYGFSNGHPQYQVNTTLIDAQGRTKSAVKDVKINGKNCLSEKP